LLFPFSVFIRTNVFSPKPFPSEALFSMVILFFRAALPPFHTRETIDLFFSVTFSDDEPLPPTPPYSLMTILQVNMTLGKWFTTFFFPFSSKPGEALPASDFFSSQLIRLGYRLLAVILFLTFEVIPSRYFYFPASHLFFPPNFCCVASSIPAFFSLMLREPCWRIKSPLRLPVLVNMPVVLMSLSGLLFPPGSRRCQRFDLLFSLSFFFSLAVFCGGLFSHYSPIPYRSIFLCRLGLRAPKELVSFVVIWQ